jgi:hypothetical protein
MKKQITISVPTTEFKKQKFKIKDHAIVPTWTLGGTVVCAKCGFDIHDNQAVVILVDGGTFKLHESCFGRK